MIIFRKLDLSMFLKKDDTGRNPHQHIPNDNPVARFAVVWLARALIKLFAGESIIDIRIKFNEKIVEAMRRRLWCGIMAMGESKHADIIFLKDL